MAPPFMVKVPPSTSTPPLPLEVLPLMAPPFMVKAPIYTITPPAVTYPLEVLPVIRAPSSITRLAPSPTDTAEAPLFRRVAPSPRASVPRAMLPKNPDSPFPSRVRCFTVRLAEEFHVSRLPAPVFWMTQGTAGFPWEVRVTFLLPVKLSAPVSRSVIT